MFFRKKRKAPQPVDPNVSNVRWILLAFVVLGYLANSVKTHSFVPVQNGAEIKASLLHAVPHVAEGFTDYKNLFPPEPPQITITDVKAGKGGPAVCGQSVTLTYKSATDGKPLPEKADADSPLTFRIGEHKVIPAFEEGIVGMQKGGQRIINAPAGTYDPKKFGDLAKEATLNFTVDLLDVQPTLPDTGSELFRIGETRIGTSHLIYCGSEAKVKLVIRDLKGKQLYATPADKTIDFTTGSSEVFLGLEQGIIGMRAGGKRTLSVPPGFQKTMRGNAPKADFPFPDKQTVLVEVEAIP